MKIDFKYIGLLFFLVIGTNNAFSQWDTTWIKTYGGNRDDVSNDMILTPDNGFLLIGSTGSFGFDNSQMYFLKLDSIGNIMWSKSHGGPQQESGTALIQTSDGGYLGVGFTSSWGAGGYDLFLVKLDANGNLEYEAVKGGIDWDFAWDVIEASPGKYVICGETQSFGNGNSDGWLLQFDEATKTWDWETTVGQTGSENIKAITKGFNGGYYTVGMGHKNDPSDDDIMVVKFNNNGDSLWSTFYGDTHEDFGNDIIATIDSNFAITGVREFDDSKPLPAVLLIDDAGIIDYDTIWPSPTFERGEGKRIAESLDKRIIIAGNIVFLGGNSDMYLGYTFPSTFFFSTGSSLGDNSTIEECNTLINLESGGFAISGKTDGFNNSFTEILMYKTNVDCVTASNDFDNVKDSINIVGINQLKTPITQTSFNSETGLFTIFGNQDYSYSIYDLTGKLITAGKLINEQPTNILPNYTTGMFIITAFSQSNDEQIKLLLYRKK